MNSLARVLMMVLLLAATPLSAQEIPQGCFHREYSEKHMAGHPAQFVKELTLKIYQATGYEDIWADLLAQTAKRGRVADHPQAGKALDQALNCWSKRGKHQCAVDCDGGSFEIVRGKSNSITIETSYLTIGPAEECGGAINMVEVLGEPVRYRLNRVDPEVCAPLQ